MLAYRLIVILVAALNAALLASGVEALVHDVGEVRGPDPEPERAASAAIVHPPRSAAIILSRNVFDSLTGPLDVAPIVVAALPPPPRDPLRAPRCGDVVVLATAEFQDPRDSFATLRVRGESRGSVRRVGDRVGAGVVAFIGQNPLELTPAVWIERGEELCQSALFEASAASPPPAPAPPPRVSKRRHRGLPPEIAARIQRLGPTLVQVDRSIVDRLVREYPLYTRGAQLRVIQEGGKVLGLQLSRMRSSGLLARLGFKAKDRIESLNGNPVSSPAAALAALGGFRSASQIRVGVTRDRKPMVLELAVR